MFLNYVDPRDMGPDEYERFRERCDAMGSARFRMMREACGIGQKELAEWLGVRPDTAKDWENPSRGRGGPSLRAWALVEAAYAALLDSVDAAVRQAEASGGSEAVRVAYRRGFKPLAGGETVNMANARARAVVVALRALGYDAEVEWDEGCEAGLDG